jgi:hypothetical protein
MSIEVLRRELLQVLWACHQYWKIQTAPPHERIVCYSWAIDPYRDRFGGTFHQSKLRILARLGFLKEARSVRGGSRRYYQMPEPDRVAALVASV